MDSPLASGFKNDHDGLKFRNSVNCVVRKEEVTRDAIILRSSYSIPIAQVLVDVHQISDREVEFEGCRLFTTYKHTRKKETKVISKVFLS